MRACYTSVPEWELTEESLLAFYRVDPRQFAIIIDLKPRMQDPVSLYQLKHVWGYSANEWTPLALEFEGLYVEERLPPAETQQEFTMPLERTPPIYEFLYVNADAFKGTCTFGKVGYVNGTLLFEPAFHSLVSRINHKRQTVDRLPPIGCT